MKGANLYTVSLLLLTIFIVTTHQFSFLFNYDNNANGVFVVTHSPGYTGTGANNLPISVGVDPTSQVSNIADLRTPVLNNILIWNLQLATTSNTGALADFNKFDLESVTLHEMGHSLGIAHTNLASESLLTPPQSEATAAYAGTNSVYDVDPGNDGVYGSADDKRGDDVNFFFFNPTNNPFVLTTPVDKSTYKNSLTFLPPSDSFATCPGLAESVLLLGGKKRSTEDLFFSLGQTKNRTAEEEYFYQKMLQNAIGKAKEIEKSRELCSEVPLHHRSHQERDRSGTTEAVMQQGTYNGEFQRQLTADDVAAIKYAQTGLDETAGTSDDYSFSITYAGDFTGNTIDVFMDPTYAGLGVSQSSAFTLGSGFHYVLDTALIRINPNINWFFNPLLATVLTFPSSQSTTIVADQTMNIELYFASSGPSTLSTSDFTLTSTVGGSLLLTKKQTNHYTISISGFTGAGNPCLSFSSTTKTDSRFGTTYDVSNQVCFVTVAVSPSLSPSPSASASSSSSASASSTRSRSVSPSSSATVTVSASVTPSLSVTPTVTPTVTVSASITPTISVTPTVTPTVTVSASITPTISVTPSVTASSSASSSNTPSSSFSATTSPSLGPTLSNSLSRSSSVTATPSSSASSSATKSSSITKSISITPSISISSSISESISITPSRTKTPVVFESIPVSLAPTVTKSPSLSVSPDPSNSSKRTTTPTVSVTPKKSKTPTSTITPLPSISAHQKPTGDVLNYFVSLSCTQSSISCCASFINEWSALSAINDVNLVRIISCEPRGNVIDITYEQSGSQRNTATAIMKSYFKLAECGANVEDTCYPQPGSLNTDSWNYVFILSPSEQVQSFSYTTVVLPSNPPPYYVYYDFTSFVGSSLLGKYQSSSSSLLEVGFAAYLISALTLLFSFVVTIV